MTRSNVRRGAVSAVAAAGAIALVLGAAAPATAEPGPDGIVVDLLSITDFHGALASMPNITAQVDAFRDANADTLFSSAGDSIGGSTFESAIARDVPTLDLLDAARLDASAVGNHEFDQGFDDLVDRVQPLVDFPYLGANVVDEATGEPALPPFEIVTTDSGVTVAYIGTVTQQTATVVSPAGIEGLTFTNPIDATNEWADILSNGFESADDPEADIVVALAHEATAIIAPGLNANVDAAFTGHSHQELTATTNFGAPVVQSEAAGTHLGHIQLTLASDGSVTSQVAENLDVTAMTPAEISSTATLPAESYDEESVGIVRAAYADAQELGDERVGSIGADFNAAVLVSGATNGTSTPSNRGAESPLGNLLAEVYAETVRGFDIDADFGIMNPGGVRKDLDQNRDGIVTFREAFNVTPFGNTVGTVDLTADQVDTLLEQQFVSTGREPRPMLALGLSPDISYLYDPTAPIGERIDEIFIGGLPMDPAGTYTVASNTFLLEGADGFTVLAEGANLLETGVVDATAFQDYLAARDTDVLADRMAPTYLQQSVGLTAVTPLDQVFAPGDEITVDLSSLSFTSTEPMPQEVVASVAPTSAATSLASSALDAPAAAPGTVLATEPIDNEVSIVPSVPGGTTPVPDPDPGQGSNETGRASVTITVPEDTEDGEFTVRYAWAADEQFTQFVDVTVTVAADDVPPSVEPSIPPSETPPSASPSTPPAAGGSGGSLPQTGAELAGPAVALAALLLALGLGLVVRRRRSA